MEEAAYTFFLIAMVGLWIAAMVHGAWLSVTFGGADHETAGRA